MAKFSPQRILCPIDFSEQSAVALRVAASLAQALSAEVRVLHAQRFEAPVYFTSAQLQSLRKQLRRSQRAAQKFAEDFAASHLPETVARSVRIIDRDPVEAILDEHREWGADLLVMGTHGRTGLTRLRLGSVMESVLRQMKGPVLTVGPGVTAPPAAIHRILSPVDFTELSQEALRSSVDLAESTGAEVTALHVVENRPEVSLDKATSEICDWIPPGARTRCALRDVVREGNPSESIVAEARRLRAHLVVLGARPRSYLGGLVFGSTTEAVIRAAPCPVLSVIQSPRRRTAT